MIAVDFWRTTPAYQSQSHIKNLIWKKAEKMEKENEKQNEVIRMNDEEFEENAKRKILFNRGIL